MLTNSFPNLLCAPLLLAALGPRCCACAFSGLVSAACSLAALVWASHCDGFSRCRAGPERTGSVVVAHRLRYPEACGAVADRESNLCALRCQAGSSRLGHRLLPLLPSPSVVSDPVRPHRRRPAPGIPQARALEWLAVSFSSA